MKRILITGAAGFIGASLCANLAKEFKVVGVDVKSKPDTAGSVVWEHVGITEYDMLKRIFDKYSFDAVIHCAAIAHQKIGSVDSATYFRVNCEASAKLAELAAASNKNILFIFLSTVSVYGETGLRLPVHENAECRPSSDYAASKLEAENRLLALSNKAGLDNLAILRLAPVYDRDWSFNIDRRVLMPLNIAYIRFGTGLQKMSALSRPNLVHFIVFLLQKNSLIGAGITKDRVFNVSDADAYTFSDIIRIFRKSDIRPARPTVVMPLSMVFMATRIAGLMFQGKKKWLHSCYDKLASSLVFDNQKMLMTGFKPIYSMQRLFISDNIDI